MVGLACAPTYSLHFKITLQYVQQLHSCLYTVDYLHCVVAVISSVNNLFPYSHFTVKLFHHTQTLSHIDDVKSKLCVVKPEWVRG